MAHIEQHQFCLECKRRFPQFFQGTKVLEVGSLNVNGTIRGLFTDCEYLGIDVGEGPGVDLVCKGHELDRPDGFFDVVCTTEALEHDMYIEQTLRNELRMLRQGGLFFMTAAGHGRPEHGTPRTDAYSSPNTCKIPGWASYYRNVTASMLSSILNLEETFQHFFLWYHAQDIYLWGIKR